MRYRQNRQNGDWRLQNGGHRTIVTSYYYHALQQYSG